MPSRADQMTDVETTTPVSSMSAPQTPAWPVIRATPDLALLLPPPADATGTEATGAQATGTGAAIGPLAGRQVLVVCPEYAPRDPLPGAVPDGGAAPYTTAIAEHLATSADGVTVLTGVPRHADGRVPAAYQHALRTAEPGWYALDHPHVMRLGRYGSGDRPRPGTVRRTLHELTFLANALSAGRRRPADLVVGIVPGPGGAAAAARLAHRFGAPLVTVVQAPVGADGAGGSARRMERFALRHSTRVAVTAESFREQLLAAGVEPERLELLPAWSLVRPSTLSRAAARHALGWDQARFVAVATGPVGDQQDTATAIGTARLLATWPDDAAPGGRAGTGGAAGTGRAPIEILVVGEGPQRAALEQQAFGVAGVRFGDPVDDALALVLAAADVLLLGESAANGAANGAASGAATGSARGTATTSGLLAGYLAAGRAVVAAVPAGSPTAAELHRAGGAGIRVDPGDPVALARVLLELRAADDRREAMGRAGARHARTHLDRRASLRRLDAIVEAALGDPGRSGHGATGGC